MARPFFETLRDLRGGATLDELASAVAEVVAAVRVSRKAGEITLKLKVKPPKNGDVDFLMIEDSVIVKVPRSERGDTVFFPLHDNSLSRSNPAQRTLDLQAVETQDADAAAAQGRALETSQGAHA